MISDRQQLAIRRPSWQGKLIWAAADFEAMEKYIKENSGWGFRIKIWLRNLWQR